MKRVLFFLITIILLSCSSNPKESIDESDAKYYAEQSIEKLLKAPSTAKFSDISETIITPITSYEIEFGDLPGYKVIGFVDAQNGFGAMIRNNYSVEIYYNKENGDILTKNKLLY